MSILVINSTKIEEEIDLECVWFQTHFYLPCNISKLNVLIPLNFCRTLPALMTQTSVWDWAHCDAWCYYRPGKCNGGDSLHTVVAICTSSWISEAFIFPPDLYIKIKCLNLGKQINGHLDCFKVFGNYA